MRRDYKVFLTLIIIVVIAGILLFHTDKKLDATEASPPYEVVDCISDGQLPEPGRICPDRYEAAGCEAIRPVGTHKICPNRAPCPLDAAE